MNPLTLEGLTDRQRRLADCIWSIDSMNALKLFISGLGDQDQQDARLVLELMTVACFDEQEEISPVTRDIIQRAFQV
jgi:hypothetical protein